MSRRDVPLLSLDILEAMTIARYTAGRDFGRLVSDALVADAVIRNLEIGTPDS